MRAVPLRAAAALALAGLAVSAAGPAAAAGPYGLQPEEIAPGVFVMWGAQEEVSPRNGANIANIGFIAGGESVLAIDAGPTRIYAEEMLAAIARATGKPVSHVAVTHHHFDHAFGIPVFRAAGAEVLMHAGAAPWLEREGAAVLENIALLAGEEWMEGTTAPAPPDRLVEADTEIDLGGRAVDIQLFENGHTAGDLAVFDRRTGVLFAGDLVFHGRAPSLPHGDAEVWRAQLADLAARDWRILVPGHGPAIRGPGPLRRMATYLGFVHRHAACSWARGDSRAEALETDLPEAHAGLALVQREFQRSVFQLWRKFEANTPPPCD